MRVQSFVVIALVLSPACGSPATITLVVDNATVIDPRSGEVLPSHSVFVDGDRIVGVEPSGRARSAVAPDTVDGTGRFVIPGLIDMHVHAARRVAAAATLDLLLANGVTGFRDMNTVCWDPDAEGAFCTPQLRQLEQDIEAGARTAPRPLALGSTPVNGVSARANLPEGAPPFLAPETGDDGVQLARWWAEFGIDFVKMYNSVPREAYFAIMEEANRLGLEVSGHLPLGVSVVEASNAGQRTIEHARDLPVACGGYTDEYRGIMARVVEREEGVRPPAATDRIRSTLAAFDEETCGTVFQTLVTNGTYLVPTHGTREMDYRASDSTYRNDERRRYIHPAQLERWDRDLNSTAEASPELVALFGEFYDLGLRLTAMAHAAGVKVMAGTDANDTMIFPGFGLHDELARFADVGIDPMDVLRTATTTPAEYFDRAADLGTVSSGALADLVILDADPLADIRNTQSIRAVVLGGRVLDRSALDSLLQGVERLAAAGGSPDAGQ